jgi:hypothetical protein
MVPEAYVLESARIAALGVFQTLFEADVAPLLDGDMARTPKHTERALFPAQNDGERYVKYRCYEGRRAA